MKLMIIDEKIGGILYSSYNTIYTSELAKLFFTSIIEEELRKLISIEKLNFDFIYQKYNHSFFILFQIKSSRNSDKLKQKYIENIIDLFKKNGKNIRELKDYEYSTILYDIYPSSLKIDIISNNEKILDLFFQKFFGIEVSFSSRISTFGIKSWNKKLLFKGFDYFSQESRYISLIYFFNDQDQLLLKESRIKHIKSMDFVIYLENQEDLINSEFNEIINTLKESENLKQGLILVNNPSNAYDKFAEKVNTALPIEKFSIDDCDTEKLKLIILKYFSEYIQT